MLFGEAGGRSVAGAFVAVLIALACALAVPAVASAETFEVNSAGDGEDAVPGDEFCKTAAEECTLRAAIEESNALGGEDTIGFTETPFDGQAAGTISPATSLPPIAGTVSIEGECVVADVLRPCVGLDAPSSSDPALVVENAESVQVDGLAITGAETGIEVVGGPRFKALVDWFGVRLDGSADGNGTGVLLGPGSDNSRIGNEGEANVFANSTGDGLDIHGASGVRVLGGYFGVGPDGVTPAANDKDIEVTAFSGSAAVGTTIGTQLSSPMTATPGCDGGCNVISGSASSGIDLEGDGGEEAAAAATTVIGNYIGLGANGTTAVPNTAAGVHVGPAAGTVIGGPRASEANRLGGGGVAVLAGPAAVDLVVRGNAIGVGADGGDLAPPEAGIVVNSEGLSGFAAEAVIDGNEIRMQGGTGIDLKGLGGWIIGNAISGAETGIRTYDPTEEHGNLIEGNLIEDSVINGIVVESSFNEVLGNEVIDSGGAGILLEGANSLFGFGVSANLVGGNAPADENLIVGSGGAAVEISNLENTDNEVARNRGTDNAGPFIDLVAASPGTEPKGPNKGIKPPAIAVASGSEASGAGALPGARIRVFRKAGAAAGEIESFLGEAIAGEKGNWKVVYGAPVAGGTIIAATQTSLAAATSELATATTPPDTPVCLASSCQGPPAPPPPPPPPAPPVPDTRITKGAKARSDSTTAKFKFSSSVENSTFQCKLDKKSFGKCRSPKQYKGLKPGKHVFKVRAVNSAGQADPTPAQRKFQVLP